MKKFVKKLSDDSVNSEQNVENVAEVAKKHPLSRLKPLKIAILIFLILTVITGIIYPVSVTLTAQVLFPYEANGSVIEVTLKDGTKKIFGSELIGQSYEEPKYMFGRVNTGAPSNMSPESAEYKALLEERIAERKEKLNKIGYIETDDIPLELITASGSGVDPHISPDTAYFQIPVIVYARNLELKEKGELSEENKWTNEKVEAIIDKYTENRGFLMFGEKRVNVLLVNLALDGLL